MASLISGQENQGDGSQKPEGEESGKGDCQNDCMPSCMGIQDATTEVCQISCDNACKPLTQRNSLFGGLF